MIFLQKKINSVIEKILVDKSVCCHVCGKQVKHRDENTGTNYMEFRSFDTSRLVKQFYTTVSIRKVQAESGKHSASGILIENLSTGEVIPILFSHRYFLRKFKYSKKQDDSHLDIEFDLIRNIMNTLNEEQIQSFSENLFIDTSIFLRSFKKELGIKTTVRKQLPVHQFQQFNEYLKSSNSSKVSLQVNPISPNNLDLSLRANKNYKHKIFFLISSVLLSWAKRWAEENYGKIKRPCVQCQLRKIEKMAGWATTTFENIENFNSMSLADKVKSFS